MVVTTARMNGWGSPAHDTLQGGVSIRFALVSVVLVFIMDSVVATGLHNNNVILNQQQHSSSGGDKGFEPMVAMYCSHEQGLGSSAVEENKYYNKYLSESGIWLTDTDPKATCSHDKVRF